MTKTNIQITRYEDGDFYVDIIDNGPDFEAWLTAKEYGVSEMLMACPKDQENGCDVDFYAFLSMVEYTLPLDEDAYAAKYMQEG